MIGEFLGLLLLLTAPAALLSYGAEAVAALLKVSPVTIAIILGPLASEMPEKITAYITVIRDGKLAEISVCNFIGSKVNHNSLLLGTMPIIALLQGRAGVPGIISLPFITMTALTVVATLSLSRRRLREVGGSDVYAPLWFGHLGRVPPWRREAARGAWIEGR